MARAITEKTTAKQQAEMPRALLAAIVECSNDAIIGQNIRRNRPRKNPRDSFAE